MYRALSNSSATFKNVTHIIFDMDGVILNSEPLYAIARENVIRRYGREYNRSREIELKGLLGSEVAEKLIELCDLPLTVEEFLDLLREEYKVVMATTPLMPDTEGIYQKAIADVAKKYGKVYTPEIRSKVVGTVQSDTAKIAIAEMKLPISREEFIRQFRSNAYSAAMERVSFMSGAAKLIRHLHYHRVPIAVATSSSADSYQIKTKQHQELFSLFSHIVTGGTDSEVKRGKPHPDIFLVCASRFPDRPSPEQCLVFEDAPNGVRAAVSANMQVVMIPDEQVSHEDRKLATVVVGSLEEVRLDLFGLPPLK